MTRHPPRLPKWIDSPITDYEIALTAALSIAWASLDHYNRTWDGYTDGVARKAMRKIRGLGK